MDHWDGFVKLAESADAIHYAQSMKEAEKALIVWTFSIVRRGTEVLTYRTGRYRAHSDSFTNKRTIGFPGVISFYDCTLFSTGDYGATENALDAISADLDISAETFHQEKLAAPQPRWVLKVSDDSEKEALAVVLDWECPIWFEPTTRRLSLNEPQWLDLAVPPNNIDDFEPWTRAAIAKLLEQGLLT